MKKQIQRPYWHKDVQWLCALLLIPLLGLTLLAHAASRATERESAIAATSAIIASLLSPGGLDDPSSINEFTRSIRQSGSITPIPNFTIEIRADEIEGKSPRELRLLLFGKIAEPIYDNGEAGLQSLATSSEIAKSLEGQLGIMKILTNDTHVLVRTVALWLTLATFILLLGLIAASRGFARMFAPGILLVLVSAPGAALFTALARMTPHAGVATEKDDILRRIGNGLSEIAPLFGAAIAPLYQTILITGSILIACAILGKIIFVVYKKVKK